LDKLREECGIVAVSLKNNIEAAQLAYFALNGLQHRGQQSAGVAVCNDGVMSCYKDMGLVTEVLDEQILTLLKGEMALGHVKYGPAKESFRNYAQPLVINYKNGSLATAFNGALVNGGKLRERMEDDGVIFSTKSDNEVIAALIARYDKGDITDAVKKTMQKITGGYALCIMNQKCLIGARDPFGIRPLVLGRLADGYTLASESCAFDMMDGEFIRDVKPGEIVIIEGDKITSHESIGTQGDKAAGKKAICSFEYVYFARPDSTIDGLNVYDVRENAGRTLAAEHPVNADIVIGVPDSGTPAAIGYALGSGIPYRPGLIKNKYVGRIFIQPTTAQREFGMRIKLNPIDSLVRGKSVVLVDDSIVRGITMRKIITSLRNVGAKEVHLRISSPPIRNRCYFGVDTTDVKNFIATSRPVEEIRQELEADSLAFISLEGLLKTLGGNGNCAGCFNGEYPIDI